MSPTATGSIGLSMSMTLGSWDVLNKVQNTWCLATMWVRWLWYLRFSHDRLGQGKCSLETRAKLTRTYVTFLAPSPLPVAYTVLKEFVKPLCQCKTHQHSPSTVLGRNIYRRSPAVGYE
jgi:hypothetical protein